MTCIKTGAYVSLPDYGMFAVADISTVGNTYVVRFSDNLEKVCSFKPLRLPTHVLWLNNNGDDIYWRKDLGIAVVPKDALAEVVS